MDLYIYLDCKNSKAMKPTVGFQTPLGLCPHDPTGLEPKALSTKRRNTCSQTSGHHLEEWEEPAAQVAHGKRKDVGHVGSGSGCSLSMKHCPLTEWKRPDL